MTKEEAAEIILNADIWESCDACEGVGLLKYAFEGGSAPADPEPANMRTTAGQGGQGGLHGEDGASGGIVISAYGGGGGGSAHASAGVRAGGGGGIGQSTYGDGWAGGVGVGGAGGRSSTGMSQQVYERCSYCGGTGRGVIKPLYVEACKVLDKPLPLNRGLPKSLTLTVG